MAISRKFNFDNSARFLILSNLFSIILALIKKWDLSEIMWVYWGQSVIIGYYNWKRIRFLKQFSTDGLMINDRPLPPTRETQRLITTFFAFHYGLFHFAYMVFLLKGKAPLLGYDILLLGGCFMVFVFNHRYSFRYNLERDLSRVPNIGTIMIFPYARIIPMHFTIILGNHYVKGNMGTLLLFLILKTAADLIMHLVEHRAPLKDTDH